MYEHYKEMSRAAGARKPDGSQKARALWEMKTGERIFMTQSAKTTFCEGIKTRLWHWTKR